MSSLCSCAELSESTGDPATAADYNAVAAGFLHHSVGIVALKISPLPLPEFRVREVFFQALDFIQLASRVTLRSVRVQLRRRLLLPRYVHVQVRVVLIVNADAEFHGDGNIGAFGRFDCCSHNIAE